MGFRTRRQRIVVVTVYSSCFQNLFHCLALQWPPPKLELLEVLNGKLTKMLNLPIWHQALDLQPPKESTMPMSFWPGNRPTLSTLQMLSTLLQVELDAVRDKFRLRDHLNGKHTRTPSWPLSPPPLDPLPSTTPNPS